MYMPFIATIRSQDGTIATRHFVTRTKLARARAEALVGPGEELLDIETNDQPGRPAEITYHFDWDAFRERLREAGITPHD